MKKWFCYFLFLATLYSLDLHAQVVQQKATPPWSGRDAAMAFTIGDKIYYGGGTDATDFYEYDPSTDTWTKKAGIPQDSLRIFGIGFSIGNKGYIGCGSTGKTLMEDLWEYDPQTDKWTQKADFPAGARDGNTAFVIGSKAYVFGGFDGKYIWGDLYVYDPSNDKWSKRLTLTKNPVMFSSSFAIGDYGYVTGGQMGFDEVAELYRYDPFNNKWEDMASFPGTARQGAIAFTVGGRAYFGLGHSMYSTFFNDLYSYDPIKNEWYGPITVPVAERMLSSVAVVNDRVFFGGGSRLENSSPIIYQDWWEFFPAVAGVKTEVQASISDIALYPNPASATVMVQVPQASGAGSITLVDATGREVLSSTIDNVKIGKTLNLSSLPQGEYFLKVQAHDVMIKKLIKH